MAAEHECFPPPWVQEGHLFSNRLISVVHKCAHSEGDNTGTLKKASSEKLRRKRKKKRKTGVNEEGRCNRSFRIHSSMDLDKALTTHDNNKGKETDQKSILWKNAALTAAQDVL